MKKLSWRKPTTSFWPLTMWSLMVTESLWLWRKLRLTWKWTPLMRRCIRRCSWFKKLRLRNSRRSNREKSLRENLIQPTKITQKACPVLITQATTALDLELCLEELEVVQALALMLLKLPKLLGGRKKQWVRNLKRLQGRQCNWGNLRNKMNSWRICKKRSCLAIKLTRYSLKQWKKSRKPQLSILY